MLKKDIKIYEIDDTHQNKTINKLSEIKGHYSNVKFAVFNPFNCHIFLSISNNNNIKIFDILYKNYYIIFLFF